MTEPKSPADDPQDAGAERIVEIVRDRYGRIARHELPGCATPAGATSCCGEAAAAARIGYRPEDLAAAPDGANLGLGCGAPIAFLALQPGETVLDLGSGAGLDAFIAARQVGPTGRVIGVDMTPDMIDKARAYAAEAGLHWTDFRLGRLEQLPVDDASVDAVTSNCVINLVPDKAAVFREVARVLRPGGRLVISDIVLDGELPPEVAGDVLAYVGCVAGALRREQYFGLLAAAGLSELTIHKDIDYLAAAGETLSPELSDKISRSGLSEMRLAGIVRSVTFSAARPV